MAEAQNDDKTEPATPRRLQRAREDGQVAVSRELTTFAGLAAVTLTLMVAGPDTLQSLIQRLSIFLARSHELVPNGPTVYRLAGTHYHYGAFGPQFLYEFGKDALGYVLFFGCFTLVDHLLRQRALNSEPAYSRTFDIRDGARLTRVNLDEVFAIASAGNYVEFVLRDGRRLLMRSPLSALETELGPRGFLRTHRSWLINATQVTALEPAGSGDYTVELRGLRVPLSRRYSEALEKLKRKP